MKHEIIFWQTLGGKEPVKEYLLSLRTEECYTLSALIDDLALHAPLIGKKGKKMVGQKKMFEIIYKNHRVLYFICEGKILLTNAFTKKSNQTPSNEIDVANRRFYDWLQGGKS